jgi:hypothetical protein
MRSRKWISEPFGFFANHPLPVVNGQCSLSSLSVVSECASAAARASDSAATSSATSAGEGEARRGEARLVTKLDYAGEEQMGEGGNRRCGQSVMSNCARQGGTRARALTSRGRAARRRAPQREPDRCEERQGDAEADAWWGIARTEAKPVSASAASRRSSESANVSISRA